MRSKIIRRPQAALIANLLLVILAWTLTAYADPYHTITVDGTITPDGVDWSPADFVLEDEHDYDVYDNGDFYRLYTTWDADNLYIGTDYLASNRTAYILIDLDLDSGLMSAATLDTMALDVAFTAGRSIDLVIARSHGLFNDPGVPGVFLVQDDTGATTDITSLTVGAQSAPNAPPSRLPAWYQTEIAIPWSVIYPDGPPAYATFDAVGVIKNTTAGIDGEDTAPDNVGEGVAGAITIESMHTSILDVDGDGVIDPANASVSGLITLPQDPGNIAARVSARLLDWAGGDLTGDIAWTATNPGDGDYRLGRLPEGQYELLYEAPGYFPATETLTVTAGETIIDHNVTLTRATTITGTLTLELGQNLGGYTFRHPDGSVLASASLLPSQFPFDFTFYVSESGIYVIEARAANHLTTAFDLDVTAGEDLLDLEFLVPRAPLLSGVVTFNSGPGADGTVTLGNAAGDSVFATADIDAADGTFSFYAPRLGDLRLSADAETYLPAELSLTAIAGTDQTDLSLSLARLPEIDGILAFADGPGHAGEVIVTGLGEDAASDTLAFSASGGVFGPAGDYAPFFMPEGDYEIVVDAPGYGLWTVPVTLEGGDTVTDLELITLAAVRADVLRMIDETGAEIVSLSATKSIPDSNRYFPEPILLEAVDSDGRRDLFDLDAKLTGLELTARKLNDVAAPRGSAWFLGSYSNENVDDIIAMVDVSAGTTQFWLANDAIEVLRIFVGPEVPDPLKLDPVPPTARIMIGFNDPRPATVVLTVVQGTLTAHADSTLTIEAQLFDTAGNLSKQTEIVSFTTLPASTGRGTFSLPTLETNANGFASATLSATGAGQLLIDCSAVVDNQVLDVRLNDVDGEPGPLPITVIAGPTAGLALALGTTVSGLTEPVAIIAQFVDTYGNPTLLTGETVQLTASPLSLGSFADVAPISDATGRALTTFQPAGTAGVVTLYGTPSSYNGDSVDLELRNVTVVTDPPYDQEPEAHSTFDMTDLTAVIVDNTPEALTMEIPFSSDWGGLQIHVLLETNWDAAGGSADAFQMPVNFGHDHRPDFILTSKFSADDYGDFRVWDGAWKFWDFAAEDFVTDPSDNNIQGVWATKTTEGLSIEIPWAPFGGTPPDSLRFEVYLTQEDGEKRSAFDSVPSDNTLNLDFDYTDPGDNDWTIALGPVTLREWSPVYHVNLDFPTPPTVTATTADPEALEAGSLFTLSARVADAGDGVGDVLADLTAISGAPLVRMYDDGDTGHGDNTAGDGVYSLRTTVPLGSPGGTHPLVVAAYDGSNLLAFRDSADVDITAQVEIIVQAGFTEDEIGDDHGPNQEGVEGLYYTYPTNSVFVTDAFDLRGLNIYETIASVGGQPVDMIAFEVSVGDFPDPDDPSTADWNPPYGDLNIQKIDIMIDNGPGGSTRGLPSRRADFQRWNAWDYAIILDGWYKAVVPSLGQNTEDAWRENALRTDADILLTGDFDRNIITALVAKTALGSPTPEDIERWSIAVIMCSHDGDADFGGVRWVNESRSEWNQGGGHYQDRDTNIMDLILIPGAGRDAGRSQAEMLNYENEFALRRLDNGETPCALEMSAFEDTGPPVVNIVKDFGEVMLREPLAGAPVAFTIEIVDDNEVGKALFSYRSTNSASDAWDAEDIPMGFVGNDLWSVDLPADWLNTALTYSPLDSMRYVEFQIYAEDIDYLEYEATGTLSPVTTVQVAPSRDNLYVQESLLAGDVTLRHVDGSRLKIGDELRADLLEEYQASTGSDLTTDSLATFLLAGMGIANVAPTVTSAPTVPRATPLGIYRSVTLDVGDSLSYLPFEDRLTKSATLSLHYTDDHLPPGKTEAKVGMFEYHTGSDRWVLIGGHVNERANTVSAGVDHTGVYGLFWTDELTFETDEVISGITVTPNPFSPNGDGLYDRASIGFYLTQEATVTVEIYNIEGSLKDRLQETFPYSGEDDANRVPRRVEGLIWDGTDANGNFVPYGIYILRLIVTYNQAGGQRTIRSNHAVAVIR